MKDKLVQNLDYVANNPFEYFIDISDLDKNQHLVKDLDLDYLDGAIYLSYLDEQIIGFREWDLIDQLWAYFLNMIDEYLIDGSSETYFPDQPIKLNMKFIDPEKILFTVEIGMELRKFFLPTKQFFGAVIASAKYFFKKISTFYSNDLMYAHEIEKITELERKFVI